MTTENTDKGKTYTEADSQWHCALGDGSAPTFISAHDDDLARDMACFLWECSRLRHGLFTPPEFIPLVSARLREYLTTHRPNTPDQTRPATGSNI